VQTLRREALEGSREDPKECATSKKGGVHAEVLGGSGRIEKVRDRGRKREFELLKGTKKKKRHWGKLKTSTWY